MQRTNSKNRLLKATFAFSEVHNDLPVSVDLLRSDGAHVDGEKRGEEAGHAVEVVHAARVMKVQPLKQLLLQIDLIFSIQQITLPPRLANSGKPTSFEWAFFFFKKPL